MAYIYFGNMSQSGQYGSDELKNKLTEVGPVLDALDAALKNVQTAIPNSPQLQQIQTFAQTSRQTVSSTQVPIPVPSNYPISDAGWKSIDAIETQAKQYTTQIPQLAQQATPPPPAPASGAPGASAPASGAPGASAPSAAPASGAPGASGAPSTPPDASSASPTSSQTSSPDASSSAPTPAPAGPNMMLIAGIGGGIVLLLLMFRLLRGKKKAGGGSPSRDSDDKLAALEAEVRALRGSTRRRR